MKKIPIPGQDKPIVIEHLVLDMNGTLALDGALVDGVPERLVALSESFRIHVLTADTFGTAREVFKDLPVRLVMIGKDNQALQKRRYLEQLGPEQTVTIGNGMNDHQMLRDAILGIAVLGCEGVHQKALAAADIIVPAIPDALDLLRFPTRLMATLRN